MTDLVSEQVDVPGESLSVFGKSPVIRPYSRVPTLSQLQPDVGVGNDLLRARKQGGYGFDDLVGCFQIDDPGSFQKDLLCRSKVYNSALYRFHLASAKKWRHGTSLGLEVVSCAHERHVGIPA
ncbi:hypothetical protein AB5J56_00775 [Streptomyces sp. R21]|uniref:Uncharacterized protein n=1 Tax=Streptomyces sp. R21 TaxID=3238627 RepID=A0AB39P0H7_9ACTN